MGCVCWFAALFLQTLKQPGGARQPCLSWEGQSTTAQHSLIPLSSPEVASLQLLQHHCCRAWLFWLGIVFLLCPSCGTLGSSLAPICPLCLIIRYVFNKLQVLLLVSVHLRRILVLRLLRCGCGFRNRAY